MPATHTAARALAALLLLAQVEGEAFEWGGTFKVDESDYAWTMAMKTTKYAEPTMKLALLKTNGTAASDLEEVEGTANTLLAGNCTSVSPYTSKLTPSTSACYTLTFDSAVYASIFKMDLSGVTNVAIFTEHAPGEFERKTHYLIDEDGHDVEPVAQHTGAHASPTSAPTADPHGDHKEWGGVLLGCLVVELCTLIGLVCMAPCIKSMVEDEKKKTQWMSATSAFAAGALLAAAVFLMIPEGAHLVGTKYKENAAAWRTGTCLLAGFIVGLIVDVAISSMSKDNTTAVATTKDEESPAIITAPDQVEVNSMESMRTTITICVGDALHNFADGIFIGAAFKVCGDSMGWTVAATAVAHEVVQELADFFVLVGPAGLSIKNALILNALSGLTVVLGGVIVTAVDIGDSFIGLILMFGAGTYLYIACVECIPRAFRADAPSQGKAIAIAMFILGTIAIGLVLLNHSHCEAPPVAGSVATAAAGGAHAGHGGH